LLKSPGGTLVYSTCTFTLEENEGLVVWALEKFPQLRLVEAAPVVGQAGVEVPGLSREQARLVQRFGHPKLTGPFSDNIGFFIAKFVSQ
jgi:16S rRNA C967 or C1407 C5-methylase (RsmB/RsmF family)